MEPPDVSAIIPTHRREREVVLAVRSVLAQERVSVECLVVDDSSDASAREAIAAIGDDRVRYVPRSVPTGGKPAIVRNEAVPLARGRYLHFLDDDDMAAEGAYADVVAELDQRPGVGVAVGWVIPFGDDSHWLDDKASYFSWAAQVGAETKESIWAVAHILFRGTLFVNSACMIRRNLFDALGGFDPEIPVYEDVDFWMRAIRRHRHVYVNRPVLLYRTGAPSLMHDLGHDESLVVSSNRIIHDKYKRDHGMLEYRLLQAGMKLLPFSLLCRIPALLSSR
jgi:GT2 family glycosyltransferase